MPTYSYRCTKCEKTFDAFHSMMCTDPQHFPDCGGAGNKLLSASSVIFKGSGFYSTDYRDSGYLEAKKKMVTVLLSLLKANQTHRPLHQLLPRLLRLPRKPRLRHLARHLLILPPRQNRLQPLNLPEEPCCRETQCICSPVV